MRIKRLSMCLGLLLLVLATLTPSHATAAIQITDGRGPLSFPTAPKRVVVLNWDLLEQVLELDVIPVGAPNLTGYSQWVLNPVPPSTIEDIGTRAEPNLDKITQLKPDVILAASPQKDLLEALGRIAPVVYLPNFRAQEQAGLAAIEHFKTLGTLFAREETARQKLNAMEQRFHAMKEDLVHSFGKAEKVVAMRFSNTTSVFIYSENSTANFVLQQLGLTPAMPLPAKPWGIVQKRLKDLRNMTDAYVLYVLPFPDEKKLHRSILWKAMPFVRHGRVRSVQPVWNYGGAMSLLYMAEEFSRSLLEMVPEK